MLLEGRHLLVSSRRDPVGWLVPPARGDRTEIVHLQVQLLRIRRRVRREVECPNGWITNRRNGMLQAEAPSGDGRENYSPDGPRVGFVTKSALSGCRSATGWSCRYWTVAGLLPIQWGVGKKFAPHRLMQGESDVPQNRVIPRERSLRWGIRLRRCRSRCISTDRSHRYLRPRSPLPGIRRCTFRMQRTNRKFCKPLFYCFVLSVSAKIAI